MPDGVVQWFDPKTGEAAIVRGGRVFPAAASDVEPVARRAGMHVHFDIERDAGVERAVDVMVRRGRRTSPRQHRLGTLAGARRPDTKGAAPFARPHPEVGLSLASHPMEVARAWARALEAGDLDGALALYAPDAVVHADGRDASGRSHVMAVLEALPVLGAGIDAELRGADRVVVVHWPGGGDGDAGVEAQCLVAHGRIAEQWLGAAGPGERVASVEVAGTTVPLAVATSGGVDEDDVAYATERIVAVLHSHGEPVLFARLKLSLAGDPARERPALAQVSVDLDGDLVRAHVAGHEMREAADLLQRRLGDKLEHRARHLDALRTRSGVPEPGEWRHGDVATVRPSYFDRPAEERQLVRHKTFAVDEMTPDEAAFDLELLDYDFHLFRDVASGEDALLERVGDGGYRLTRLRPVTTSVPTAVPLSVVQAEPPALTVDQALDRLHDGGEPFVFFANASTGRGNVVYRRYDGHDGLITPA